MADRHYYVSWVDKRTDPWPQWERLREGLGDGHLGECPFQFLPADHREWPGVPLLDESAPAVVSDSRMGQYLWPGIPLLLEGRPRRLYLGPTLSALFHPVSRFRNLEGLETVYLLYQAGLPGSPHELLEKVLRALCEARGIKHPGKRVQFVPIAGISDPTEHAAIIRGIEQWLRREDPFDLGGRRAAGRTTRITVNLSTGTPAMHASWLLLRWNGALGGPQSVVDYVQGDGGLATGPPTRDPLRTVPIDVLSQMIGREAGPAEATSPVEPGVGLEELAGPPYDELRQKIDQAAMLGLPLLLQGERGTGKTFLARYYHERRQLYRQQRGKTAGPARGRTADAAPAGARFPEKLSEDTFVTVVLSEFADLETLRDTLFGWAKGSWTGAVKAFDGLLGEAHQGTLFLDEVHHLGRGLQAALLGPLNNHRYRPKMATYEVVSDFALVVATNDPQWRTKMADDFRDRVERIVLQVPSFRSFQRRGADLIWKFWEHTLRCRCRECGLDYTEGDGDWPECREQLLGVFRRHPLPGNWRDLQRLADNVLLHLTDARGGRPTALRWHRDQLEQAIGATFTDL